jgi:hypothetical protein
MFLQLYRQILPEQYSPGNYQIYYSIDVLLQPDEHHIHVNIYTSYKVLIHLPRHKEGNHKQVLGFYTSASVKFIKGGEACLRYCSKYISKNGDIENGITLGLRRYGASRNISAEAKAFKQSKKQG